MQIMRIYQDIRELGFTLAPFLAMLGKYEEERGTIAFLRRDGSRETETSDGVAIYIMKPDGSDQVYVRDADQNSRIAWSPDSKRIVFLSWDTYAPCTDNPKNANIKNYTCRMEIIGTINIFGTDFNALHVVETNAQIYQRYGYIEYLGCTTNPCARHPVWSSP